MRPPSRGGMLAASGAAPHAAGGHVRVAVLMTAPASVVTHASGLLARQNVKAAVRTTSTTAPVLVMIGVAGSLLAAPPG